MKRNYYSNDSSNLEQQFELEMEGVDENEFEDIESENVQEGLEGIEGEFEDVEEEVDDTEGEFDDIESEYDDVESEFEDIESEFEDIESDFETDHAEQLYQLAQREFESESEADEALNEVLSNMEKEFFFGKLAKAVKGVAKRVTKSSLFKNAWGLAKSFAKKYPAFQAFKAITKQIRGGLNGKFRALAKSALRKAIGTALRTHPLGASVLPALNALGFKEGENPEDNKQFWNNYVNVARESYDYLVKNINGNIGNPAVASQLATKAFKWGINNVVKDRKTVRVPGRKRRRVIYAKQGDIIVIKVV